LEKILNLDAFHSRPQLTTDYGQHDHDETHDHDRDAGKEHEHDHFRGVSSLNIPLPVMSPQHEEILDEWIRKLLWEGLYEGANPEQNYSGNGYDKKELPIKILRCKGVYWTTTGNQVVIQGVQTLYETTVVGEDRAPERGKLVLIGTGLGKELSDSLVKSLKEVKGKA
jgi:G3E family GTPase